MKGEAGRAEGGGGRRDRGCPFLFCGEAPRSPCLRLIIYNDGQDGDPSGGRLDGAGWAVCNPVIPLTAAGRLRPPASPSRLRRSGSWIKYPSNLETVFSAAPSLETEIKLLIRCRATGVARTGKWMSDSGLHLVKFHVPTVLHVILLTLISALPITRHVPSLSAQRLSPLIRSDRPSTSPQPLRGSLEQGTLFPRKCFELGYFYRSIKVILQILGYYLRTFGGRQSPPDSAGSVPAAVGGQRASS